VRLLGENLIGFRTTAGKVGLLGDLCPHRCASLFYGRNEEEGLRCIYHGWKYDVTGACVDQPGEPEESRFESRIFATAYPCVERNGVVWTYMGPRRARPVAKGDPSFTVEVSGMGPVSGLPPVPDIEANMQADPTRVNRTLRHCNWLQALEGDIDTVHSEYLHAPARINLEDLTPGTGSYYRHRLRKPFKLSAVDTPFGTSYGAYRPAEENTTYWRIAHFLFPCSTETPSPAAGSSMEYRMWVPVDDEHVLRWTLRPRNLRPRPSGNGSGGARPTAVGAGREDGGSFDYLPNTSDWLGRFRPVQRAENDYLIDRGEQKAVDYTGIRGGAIMEDTAVTESMGALLDRTKEHLGVSDTMIVRTRQRLLSAVRALADEGVVPPGVDNPGVYRTRAGWLILPDGVDWWEGSRELRETFVDLRDESQALAALNR